MDHLPEWKPTFDGSRLVHWAYRLGKAHITIEPRPPYCDRGHWWAKCWDIKSLEGFESIDSADGWPRYYMSLAVAKHECSLWLDWRLRCEGVCWL